MLLCIYNYVVKNEMEEIQHYHNTIYKCIDYCVAWQGFILINQLSMLK
jgi:hypothetical protein